MRRYNIEGSDGKLRAKIEANRRKYGRKKGVSYKRSMEVVGDGIVDREVRYRQPETGETDIVASRNRDVAKGSYAEMVARLEWVRQKAMGIGKEGGERVWEEDMVRVGTGYRVREGAKGGRRERDRGYGHRRKHVVGEGRVAEVGKAHTSRKICGKGEGCRQKVINEVYRREARRPRSVYTGCGRSRKSRIGKKKLKSTKVALT